MTTTSKKLEGAGESGCLEYASYQVSGDAGNFRVHEFSFVTQQPVEVEQRANGVHITITGDQEFADIVRFISEATKS